MSERKRRTPEQIFADLEAKIASVKQRAAAKEAAREVKSTPILKRLPVIVLTSSREEGDRALTYDIGANSYIVKPVSFGGFLDVIRQIEGYWISLNVAPPELAS